MAWASKEEEAMDIIGKHMDIMRLEKKMVLEVVIKYSMMLKVSLKELKKSLKSCGYYVFFWLPKGKNYVYESEVCG